MHNNKKEDLWSEYKKTVTRIFCDKIPITNYTKETGDLRKRKSSKKFQNELDLQNKKSLPQISEYKTDQMFHEYTSYNNKYTISTHTNKEKRRPNYRIKLDLHGCTLDNLQHILKNFCMRCVYMKEKEVLIITGKGEGIIRKATEDWFHQNPSIIIKYSPVYDSQREVGSFYVLLRLKLRTK